MSDHIIAKYVFLPWYRVGISTQIQCTAVAGHYRASVPITLTISANDVVKDTPEDVINQTLELISPGDVTGFDPRIITRIEPKKYVGDFEPNYFPCVEFSSPDFPWRYTPQNPSCGVNPTRLQPWICLIVLEDEVEYTENKPTSSGLPHSITIKKTDTTLPIPNLDQMWAWAHTQLTVSGEDDPNSGPSDNELKDILENHPEQSVSRIMCPRWLRPRKKYTAFLVPTFDSGVKAGLGQDLTGIEKDALAWDVSDDEVTLPYYYKWEFGTGTKGDFEYLVRLLEPRVIDSRVGIRHMNCNQPGYSLPPVRVLNEDEESPLKNSLGLEGALKAINSKSTIWPENSFDNYQENLVGILNLSYEQTKQTNAGDTTTVSSGPPVVTPPIYGKWHRGRSKVDSQLFPNPIADRWMNKLNNDPRNRTAVGFGTSVIQNQQERLMYSAWKQIGDIDTANNFLNSAQLACESSVRFFQKNIATLSTDKLVSLTSPMHYRVLIDDESTNKKTTIGNYIKKSIIPESVLDQSFRKIERLGGPIRKRQKSGSGLFGGLIDRINKGEISGADELEKPDGTKTLDDAINTVRPFGITSKICNILDPISKILLLILVASTFVYGYLITTFSIDPTVISIFGVVLVIIFIIFLIIRRITLRCRFADVFSEENLTPEVIESVPPKSDFVLTVPGSSITPFTLGTADNTYAQLFREFAIVAQAFLLYTPEQTNDEPKPVDLHHIKETLLESLDPRKTIPNRVYQRLDMKNMMIPTEKIDQIMDAPEFPQPMYEPLRDLSQEYLVPGLKYVPKNTLGLLLTNPRFVESYLVGLNHEMSRELLWHEYPTDQRGTYFQQFWDVSGVMMPESVEMRLRAEIESELDSLPNGVEKNARIDSESEIRWNEILKDIKPIHHWRSSGLGYNKTNSTEQNATGLETEEDTKTPIFEGTLKPDVTFLGFEISTDDAKGSIIPADEKPGWFFVIEERVSEARFGMDTLLGDDPDDTITDWNDLSWDFIRSKGFVVRPDPDTGVGTGIVDLEAAAADTVTPNLHSIRWASDAASMAWITMQKPFRVAVHSDDMIPNEEGNSDGPEGKLVLLVKGDLLKKYPSTVIYAVKGCWINHPSKWDPTQDPPIFINAKKRWPITFPLPDGGVKI